MRVNTKPPVDERQAAYLAVLADAKHKPFEWGTHDCVTFVGACVQALTGRDILVGLEWSSAFEASRVIKSMGGLQAAFTSRLGDPMPALMAGPGDVVMTKPGEDESACVAICHGPYLLALAASGLCVRPLSAGLCAWRAYGD